MNKWMLYRRTRPAENRRRLRIQHLEARQLMAIDIGQAAIIDDGQPGFDTGDGSWFADVNPSAYQDDRAASSPVEGLSTATWTFDDLESGRYQVFATWPSNPYLGAFHVPYQIFDSGLSIGTYNVNQRTLTDDVFDADAGWQAITDVVSVFSDSLTVQVSNQAQGVVVADAIRLVHVGDLPSTPAAEVLISDAYVDGQDAYLFRTNPFVEPVFLGANVTKTFHVRNTGSEVLIVSNLSVPPGFAIGQPFSQTALSAGEIASFDIRLVTDSVGTFGGNIAFETNNPISPVVSTVIQGVVSETPESMIRIQSMEDAQTRRDALIDTIWSGNGLPATAPDSITLDVLSPIPGLSNLSQVDRLQVNMDLGFTSVAYQYNPAVSNNHLAIYHRGHGDLPADVAMIQFCLDQGFTVLDFRMPLFGENTGPVATHNDFDTLESPTLNPLRFFVEPVAAVLNHLDATRDFNDRITMAGLSGGGWTTTLYAAIDPRITLSFPVAGSLPRYTQSSSEGDYEQFQSEMLATANYLEMYVLGSTGEGRSQTQILNRYDSCCFYGDRHIGYQDTVPDRIASIGTGNFQVVSDSSHTSHTISPFARDQVILPELQTQGFPLLVGSDIYIYGTDGDDVVTLEPGNTITLSINGNSMTLPATGIDEVHLLGGEGNDTLTLNDSSGTDIFTAGPGEAVLSGQGFHFVAYSFEDVHAHSIHGGYDTAILNDSSGDDVFTAYVRDVELTGAGFSTRASGFRYSKAYATTGGTDVADLYDSSGNDIWGSTPDFAHLYDTSVGYYLYAGEFDTVRGHAVGGGNDRANLFDSPGDDTFNIAPQSASLETSIGLQMVDGFQSIFGYAYQGGNDSALMADSVGHDSLHFEPLLGELSGNGFDNHAIGFATIEADASAGGYDSATFIGSEGDDRWIAHPKDVTLYGDGFHNSASGFRYNRAYAGGDGNDIADFYDSFANDIFGATPSFGHIYDLAVSYYSYASGFDVLTAHSDSGGIDTANLYDSIGNDKFISKPHDASMFASGYTIRGVGFDRQNAYARSGDDTAQLYDSTLDDQLTITPDTATMVAIDSSYTMFASGFNSVTAVAIGGGYDNAMFIDSDGSDSFIAGATETLFSVLGRSNRAIGFERVAAHFNLGGFDTAWLSDNQGGGTLTANGEAAELLTPSWQAQVKGGTSVHVSSPFGSYHAIDHFFAELTLEGIWDAI